jgi:NhaP-type Na+/H+ or K+/H+ antiporter
MILFAGLIFGFFQKRMGFLGESTTVMANMHPHLILYVFIPVLLFESGFNSDWYIYTS